MILVFVFLFFLFFAARGWEENEEGERGAPSL